MPVAVGRTVAEQAVQVAAETEETAAVSAVAKVVAVDVDGVVQAMVVQADTRTICPVCTIPHLKAQ